MNNKMQKGKLSFMATQSQCHQILYNFKYYKEANMGTMLIQPVDLNFMFLS